MEGIRTAGPSRRRFLESAAAACGVVLASDRAGGQPASPESRLVDCHLHCFAGGRDARFPYHARAPYRPERPATPEHLLRCMDGAGVRHAVVVHPEPYQDDHGYLEYCLEVGGGRLKGTLLLFADRPGWREKLVALASRLPVVAVRIHAYAPDRLPPFDGPELRQLWREATERGLAVQLHFEPRYAPRLEPLIREFRQTRVIVDHLGRPFQGIPDEHAVVVNWSRYRQVIMKLSAIPSTLQYPHRDIRPVIAQLIEAYGAERMIYGGGFGADATPETYAAAFERARSYVAHLPPADQAKILGENAVRLFGFS